MSATLTSKVDELARLALQNPVKVGFGPASSTTGDEADIDAALAGREQQNGSDAGADDDEDADEDEEKATDAAGDAEEDGGMEVVPVEGSDDDGEGAAAGEASAEPARQR